MKAIANTISFDNNSGFRIHIPIKIYEKGIDIITPFAILGVTEKSTMGNNLQLGS